MYFMQSVPNVTAWMISIIASIHFNSHAGDESRYNISHLVFLEALKHSPFQLNLRLGFAASIADYDVIRVPTSLLYYLLTLMEESQPGNIFSHLKKLL